MKKANYRITTMLMALSMVMGILCIPVKTVKANEEEIVLRVSNWEEYIDLGDWDDDELIELESGDVIGVNSIIDDFEIWYYKTYGKKVRVEYSTFGTNEDLYSQLTLGDVYDLVCPSDYMIMKLMDEDALHPLSEDFFDATIEENYYVKGVSPYIWDTFENNRIDGEAWSKYAACYMWGITGVVYNPEEITYEEAATWSVLNNKDYSCRVTIKDNVRDAYFPTLGILFRDTLTSEEFINDPDYRQNLSALMNKVDMDTINQAESLLKEIKGNVYSFETDSGKADMVTRKVVANLQWSGDAVYTLDQAEEDGVYLEWAVPKECTNLWFDGWVMLKAGIEEDANKQHAAEAFINYMSMPESAVRNMYYIGYTSAIAGGDSSLVYEYVDWCYGAEEEGEDTIEYNLGYFFAGDNESEDYVLITYEEQARRQLAAQYPSVEEINRSAVMLNFDDEESANINQMWINVRCFNLSQIAARTWVVVISVVVSVGLLLTLFLLRDKIFVKKMKNGYRRVE